MTRDNGGILGPSTLPIASSAIGKWNMDEAYRAIRGNRWPNTVQPGNTGYWPALYTGNGSSQSVSNGANLTQESLLLIKPRNSNATDSWWDNARAGGTANYLKLSTNDSEVSAPGAMTFQNGAFSVSSDSAVNSSGTNYISYGFVKQTGFFDIVTYTGTGNQQTISHNLGTTPGFIIFKAFTSGGVNYFPMVWHSSAGSDYFKLNVDSGRFSPDPVSNQSSTGFTIQNLSDPDPERAINQAGVSYVAYLFAENTTVCKTGTYNSFSSGTRTVTVGFQPRFVLIKSSSSGYDWVLVDSTRGSNVYSIVNSTNGLGDQSLTGFTFTATGFTLTTSVPSSFRSSGTFYYLAIA